MQDHTTTNTTGPEEEKEKEEEDDEARDVALLSKQAEEEKKKKKSPAACRRQSKSSSSSSSSINALSDRLLKRIVEMLGPESHHHASIMHRALFLQGITSTIQVCGRWKKVVRSDNRTWRAISFWRWGEIQNTMMNFTMMSQDNHHHHHHHHSM